MTLRQATIQLAHDHPGLRRHLVPLLRREAGREWDGTKGKKYKNSPKRDKKVKPKWQPKPRSKGKCFYETGDPKDRCYVTTEGGPGGKTKKPTEGWKEYEQARWPGLDKKRKKRDTT